MNDLRLSTIKKASEITGASTSFFKQLLREQMLTRYKIHSSTYVSLKEFETIAKPEKSNTDEKV
jgi:hypothetical protein